MPELADGQTIEIQGSAARPYIIKNVGGVYSCSCAAWRNQSLPIDQRTCKHIRQYRGEGAENDRVGSEVSPASSKPAVKPIAPPLLLAETWTDNLDPRGWWVSEKLDGVRAYWDGNQFLSRNGNRYFAPAWFTARLPAIPLDGELWIGRKQFQQTVSIVRRQDAGDAWQQVRYIVFDAPQITGPFEERMAAARDLLPSSVTSFAQALDHTVCRDRTHLTAELGRIEALGGEGLMLRQPGSLYVPSRSATLLKLKSFHDCEATVVGHQPGAGRHRGRLGALVVRLASGVECAVGTGFSDVQRERPPAIGAVITLKYQELTNAGVPRFPVYVGGRADESVTSILIPKGGLMAQTATPSGTRRFEFVQGTSSKFWEVRQEGHEVIIRYGRIDTGGKSVRKPLKDAAAAEKHIEKLIREKSGKGYVEVAA